jgi:hypothetical protein
MTYINNMRGRNNDPIYSFLPFSLEILPEDWYLEDLGMVGSTPYSSLIKKDGAGPFLTLRVQNNVTSHSKTE